MKKKYHPYLTGLSQLITLISWVYLSFPEKSFIGSRLFSTANYLYLLSVVKPSRTLLPYLFLCTSLSYRVYSLSGQYDFHYISNTFLIRMFGLNNIYDSKSKKPHIVGTRYIM